MEKEYLKKLHESLIEILDYVCEICDKNNLQYFIAYGTALGAYRHGGFIPWDDDIDIVMPRNDYEKLANILRKSNEKYTYQDEQNEKEYFLLFAKVRKNNTIFIERIVDTQYKHNGIYIDVFPLDYVDDKNSLSFKLKLKIIKYIRHVLRFKNCRTVFKEKESLIKLCSDYVISLPAFLVSNKRLLKIEKKLMTSNGSEFTAKYFAMFDSATEGIVLEKDYYLPSKKIKFENKMYNVPGKIEKYLEKHYGEKYMQLPPEDKRHTHEPIKIKF